MFISVSFGWPALADGAIKREITADQVFRQSGQGDQGGGKSCESIGFVLLRPVKHSPVFYVVMGRSIDCNKNVMT